MKKTLLLHIGHHKTGTTTLQLAMKRAYEQGVMNNGSVHYCLAGRGGMLANHHLARLVRNPKLPTDGVGGWEAAAAEAKSVDADLFVISSEAFEGLAPGRVKNRLNQHFPDYHIKLVQYVRPHLSRLLSSYAQNSKTGQVTVSFDEYVDQIIDGGAFIYAKRLAEWRNCFEDAEFIVKPFVKRLLVNNDIVNDFCQNALGQKEDFLNSFVEAEANVSPSTEVLELIRLLAKELIEAGQEERNNKVERRVFAPLRNKFESIYPQTVRRGYSSEQLRRLVSHYASDAKEVDEYFFGGSTVLTDELKTTVPMEEGSSDVVCFSEQDNQIHEIYRASLVKLVKESDWFIKST